MTEGRNNLVSQNDIEFINFFENLCCIKHHIFPIMATLTKIYNKSSYSSGVHFMKHKCPLRHFKLQFWQLRCQKIGVLSFFGILNANTSNKNAASWHIKFESFDPSGEKDINSLK